MYLKIPKNFAHLTVHSIPLFQFLHRQCFNLFISSQRKFYFHRNLFLQDFLLRILKMMWNLHLKNYFVDPRKIFSWFYQISNLVNLTKHLVKPRNLFSFFFQICSKFFQNFVTKFFFEATKKFYTMNKFSFSEYTENWTRCFSKELPPDFP